MIDALTEPGPLLYGSLALALGLAVGAWLLIVPSRTLASGRRRLGVEEAQGGLSRVTTATTGFIGTVIDSRGGAQSWEHALDRAGIRLPVPEFVLLVGAGALSAFALGMVIGGVLVGCLLGLFALISAYLVVTLRSDRRKAAFGDQLDDTLQLLASNMRAGHSLLQSLDGLAREVDEPARGEVTRVVNQVRVGRDLGDALEETAARMDSDDFRWVAQAIAIHRQVGGNLADVLDTVGETIRERNQIRRQVKALSAEGRLSAWVLMLLPFVVILMLSFSNPEYLGKLVQGPLGISMIGLAVLLLVVGGLFLRKIVTIKF